MTPAKPPASRPAGDVCRGVKLSDPAAGLLNSAGSGQQFFDALNKAGHYADAARVLCRLLPRRDAVWWGCLCAWAARRTPAGEASIEAVVRWLREPTDDHRRAAGEAGKAAGSTTAAGLIGTAALLADGSLAAPDRPAVPTKPELTPDLVAGAVLAAARSEGAAASEGRLRQFLAIGVDVFRGANRYAAPV